MVRLAQITVSLLVGLAIVLGLAAWRLAQGPISLNFLNPVLERTFSVNGTAFAARVEDTLVIWGGWPRFIDLQARNLRIFGHDGTLLALLPEISVTPSIPALARGEFAVSRMDILGIAVTIERNADGRLTFEMPVGEHGDAQQSRTVAKRTVDALFKPILEGAGAFGYLHRFSLINGSFRLVDHVRNNVFKLSEADIVGAFGRKGVDTTISLNLEEDGRQTRLDSRFLYDRESQRLTGRVDFEALTPTLIGRVVPSLSRYTDIPHPVSGDLAFQFGPDWRLLNLGLDLKSDIGAVALRMAYPDGGDNVQANLRIENLQLSSLAKSSPVFGRFAGLDVPISGRIVGTVSPAGEFDLSEVDLTAEAGQIEYPDAFAGPIPVKTMALQATFAKGLSSASIRRAAIDLGGPMLTVTGAVRRDGASYRVRADVAANQFQIADLARYWPIGLALGARKWVTRNIAKGVVTEANANMTLQVPADAPADVHLETLAGTLEYKGLDVNYWASLPKFVEVGGTGSFDRSRLRLAVASGRLRDVALEQSVIEISGLDGSGPRIAIDLVLRGALGTVTRVLDRKPLGLMTRLGIGAGAITGDAVVRANMRFPLLAGLPAEKFRVDASATMRSVAIEPGPYGLEVSHGDLNLRVDNAGLTLGGIVRLAGSPVTVDWRESFKSGAPVRRRLAVSGRIAELARPAPGLPGIQSISGPADVKFVLTQSAADKAEIRVALRLDDARILVPEIGWEKKSGVAGTANLEISMTDRAKFSVDRFSVAAGDARLSGSARPHASSRDGWRVDIEEFRNGMNQMAGRIDIEPDGRLLVAVSGKRFDLEPVLARDLSAQWGGKSKWGKGRSIRLDARFDELVWGKQRQLRNASIMAVHNGKHLRGLMIDGTIGRQGRLDVKYLPGSKGQVLKVAVDDFGQLTRALSERSSISGGTLVIKGYRHTPKSPLKGEFIANSFILSKSPLLARLLQVASLSGIVTAFSQKGLEFQAFEGKFMYNDARLTLKKVHAFGPSMGITVNGVVDFVEDETRLGGTLVPAHTINKVLGRIPIIGTLVTGGTNEGIFAANYRIAGPIDDPKVTVNTLSALAPGLLRKLFDLGAAGENRANEKSSEPSKPAE